MAYVAYLSRRLLDVSADTRAAVSIQRWWRTRIAVRNGT